LLGHRHGGVTQYHCAQKTKTWEASDRDAGVFANHGKVCSCWMCGNPRKYGELTLQERKADAPIVEE
jgi:hypothetical protein